MPYRRKDSDVWWISYPAPDGRRARESSGTTSLAEAKALEASRRLATHRAKRWGEAPPRTFDEVMLTYLKDTADKKSHARDLESATRLQAHFTGKAFPIAAEDIAAYKRARAQQPAFKVNRRRKNMPTISQATIAKELWLFSAAIRHCNREYDWQLLNPVSGRVPTPKKAAPKWLTIDQVDALRGAVRRSQHLRDFIELGLATGMRTDEMLSLTWARVDFGARLVLFDIDDQKAGIPGSIPLNETALAVLRARQEYRRANCPKSEWVFCTRNAESPEAGARLGNIKKTFGRAAERAGLKASPHCLRHTFASRLVQSGVPILVVKDLMRHADVRTTLQYAYLAPENTRDAIAVLDRFEIPDMKKPALRRA